MPNLPSLNSVLIHVITRKGISQYAKGTVGLVPALGTNDRQKQRRLDSSMLTVFFTNQEFGLACLVLPQIGQLAKK